MNAPVKIDSAGAESTAADGHPANPSGGHPAQRFPRLLALRIEQVRTFGHTAARDDARGPMRLVSNVQARLIAVSDMLMGDPARLTPTQRAVLEDRLDKATCLLIAAADALARIPITNAADSAPTAASTPVIDMPGIGPIPDPAGVDE